jgi:hypothetical protein
MGNNFLESSVSPAVSIDLRSSWAARSWENAYFQQNSPQMRVKYYIKLSQVHFIERNSAKKNFKILS